VCARAPLRYSDAKDKLQRIREEDSARKQTIERDVAVLTESYHCKLCNKQYRRLGEYEAHLTSYDHHHVKV
jgi:hypothetical protein